MKKMICRFTCFFMTVGFASMLQAQTSGANGTHDPSRMMLCNGKVYVYSTGGGSKSSTDGLVWTSGPRVPPDGMSSSVTDLVPSNQGLWAPDIIYLNNQYYYYYSTAKGACAIGLATSPTLDPNSPDYKWTDRGPVINNPDTTYSCIDPAPCLDSAGNLWLAWGSGYANPADAHTIYVTRLDNQTGLLSQTDKTYPGYPLEPGHIEASYIHYNSGYYYLFWNSGGCCDGASSTYTIHVARSKTITGPYTGEKPKWYASTGSIHGPGHIGIFDQCGYSRFTYHYYPDNGGSVLGENDLTWGSDGWPVLGPVCTTPMKLCTPTVGTKGTTPKGGSSRIVVQNAGSGIGAHLVLKNSGERCALSVVDLNGRILIHKVFSENVSTRTIPLNALKRGTYLVRITTPKGSLNQKLLLLR